MNIIRKIKTGIRYEPVYRPGLLTTPRLWVWFPGNRTDWNKMAPSMAAVLRAPRKLCSFSYVLFYLLLLLFYVLDVVCITVYDRHTFKNWFLRHAMQTGLRVLECRCLVHRHRIRDLRLGCKTEKTQAEKREESWRPRQTDTLCFPTSSSNHFAG